MIKFKFDVGETVLTLTTAGWNKVKIVDRKRISYEKDSLYLCQFSNKERHWLKGSDLLRKLPYRN